MKIILLGMCNRLIEASIKHILNQTEDFQVYSVHPGKCEIAKECKAVAADILLLEVAYNPGSTLDDCLSEVEILQLLRPECKVILVCDENSVPGIARKIAMAKKDRLIDDFMYLPVSESYFTAILYSM